MLAVVVPIAQLALGHASQDFVGVFETHEASHALVVIGPIVRVVHGGHGLSLAAQVVRHSVVLHDEVGLFGGDQANHVLKQSDVAVPGREERAVRFLVGQVLAEAEHVLNGLAKVLTEEAEERKVAREVDAREAVDERVVDEEALVEEERGPVR